MDNGSRRDKRHGPRRHAAARSRVAAGALSDLIAGRIDSMFNGTGSLLQVARAVRSAVSP